MVFIMVFIFFIICLTTIDGNEIKSNLLTLETFLYSKLYLFNCSFSDLSKYLIFNIYRMYSTINGIQNNSIVYDFHEHYGVC